MSCNVKTYGLNIKKFCEVPRPRIDGERVRVYKLKESMKNNFEIVSDDVETC